MLLYCNKNSFIHKLNPAFKFIAFVIFIALIFMPLGYFAQLIIFTLLLIVFFASKISFKSFKNIFKSILVLFILLLIINWMLYKTPIAVDLSKIKNIWYQDALFGPFGTVELDNSKIIYTNLIAGGFWGDNNNPVFDFKDHSLINKIILQNNISDASLDSLWKNLNTSYQNELLSLFNNDLTLAKKYYWISQNSFELDGIKYDTALVSNSNIYFLWFNIPWYGLSLNGINLALYITIKLWMMVLLATILTYTTSSIELANGLATLMYPLKWVKFPVNEAAIMISIALRFVPSLLMDSNRILNAQASRGLDFKNGKINTKIKSLISIIVPLFSIAFKNADDLASTMEARGYNPRYSRTKYRKQNFGWKEAILLILILGLLGVFIWWSVEQIIFGNFGIMELLIIYK